MTLRGIRLFEGPSGPELFGENDGDLLTWDAAAKQWVSEPGGGAEPLTRIVYVDAGAAPDGNGSQERPFQTLTEGLTALGLPSPLGAVYMAPGDYSAEPAIVIRTNAKLNIIGMTQPVNDETTSTAVKIPVLTQQSVGEVGSLVLENVIFSASCQLNGSLVQLIDCLSIQVENSELERARLEIVGGSVVFCEAQFIQATRALWLPLSGCLLTLANGLRLVNCSLSGTPIGVEFDADPGTVFYDLATEQQAGGPAAVATVTNGTSQRFQLPVQSITGATAQEQIDSIVAAGVALGLWTDDR